MIEWRPRRLGLGLWQSVEMAFQHGFDVLVGIGPVTQRPLGNGLQSLVAVLVAETNDAQAGTESLLGMRFGGEDAFQEFGGKRANLPAPFHQA